MLPSSIIWYWNKPGSKQAQWPHVHGLAASTGVCARTTQVEISVTLLSKLIKDFTSVLNDRHSNADKKVK